MTNKLLERAIQQHQQGNLKNALENYHKVLLDDPKQTAALHGAGIALSQLGRNDEAIHYIDRTLLLKPQNATFQNSRGNNILSQHGKLVEATIAYDQAIQLQPDYATACNSIANCFFDKKLAILKKPIKSYCFETPFCKRAFQLCAAFNRA